MAVFRITNDDTFVDKVIEENYNIRKVLALKGTFGY